MRFPNLVIALLLSTLGPVPAQSPAPLTVIVEGVAKSVPATSLKAIPRDTMQIVFHDQPAVTYEGIPLSAILKAVGVRTDSLRGPALATRLVTESSDGYRVVLALAELDPSLGGKRVLLADKMDGKPLPATEGPWRLVIGGDQRPSRSARQVLRIRIATEPK
jgi:DMSO/TMAO reductase YedYZ molybdopterin-dependent catalytic subunit